MTRYRWAAVVSSVVALAFTVHFSQWLPITDGYVSFTRFYFPLDALNLVFHEAGHWIFGILQWHFLTVAGGTIMQLLMPSAALVHFCDPGSGAESAFVFSGSGPIF